ncbi:hypothetical protein HQ563_04310 [bacterium]|nr:hypothetical protein [bacterium]
MEGSQSAGTTMRKKWKAGWACGTAICLLAIVVAGMGFPWLYLLVLIFLVLASVRAYRRRPRPKRWFVPGTIGLALVVGGIILGALFCGPDPLYVRISPVSYIETPLPEVLQDLCRHLDNRGSSVRFVLRGEELKGKTTSFRTRRKMKLREVLEKLTERAGCSFHYGVCGTGGGLLGPITISSANGGPRNDEVELWIEHDRIVEYGGGSNEDCQAEAEETEKSAGEESE